MLCSTYMLPVNVNNKPSKSQVLVEHTVYQTHLQYGMRRMMNPRRVKCLIINMRAAGQWHRSFWMDTSR
jgi:hypothetical protein